MQESVTENDFDPATANKTPLYYDESDSEHETVENCENLQLNNTEPVTTTQTKFGKA